jgi:hypothetical protein
MKTLARHLTANFFNCKNSKLQDINAILSALRDVSEHLRFTLVDSITHQLSEDHYAIMMLFHEGHLTLHVYTSLKYVALDVFLCQENACPDDVAHSMREFFKPDKIRSTLLKRGDFGTAKDIRPKTKTHLAPLRKLHNTGAKVIHVLAKRSHK